MRSPARRTNEADGVETSTTPRTRARSVSSMSSFARRATVRPGVSRLQTSSMPPAINANSQMLSGSTTCVTGCSEPAPFLSVRRRPVSRRRRATVTWVYNRYTQHQQVSPTPSASPPPATQLTSNSPDHHDANYVRNSVKGVDPRTTTTVRVLWPMTTIRSCGRGAERSPDLFTPISEMPSRAARASAVSRDLFRVQTELYSIYQLRRPRTSSSARVPGGWRRRRES